MRFEGRKLAAWLLVIVLAAASVMLIREALAVEEEPLTYSAWVMCQPDSRVNIRARPGFDGDVAGYAYPMDRLTCDGVTKDGWAHVVNPPCDAADGYVYVGYLTVEEPEDCQGRMMRVEADGRVAVRSHMCGERVMWVHPGAEVEVYQMAEEWAVTSLGFIRSKYLEGID